MSRSPPARSAVEQRARARPGAASSLASMPSAASSTRATCAFAWRPASSRSSAAPRSAASRISRTCSDVPAASDAAGLRAAAAPLRSRSISSATSRSARRRPPARIRGARRGSRAARSPHDPRRSGYVTGPRSPPGCTAWPTKWVGPCRPVARVADEQHAAGERRLARSRAAIRKRDERRQLGLAPRSCRSPSPPPGRSPSRAAASPQRRAGSTCRPSGERADVDPHARRAGSAAARGRPPRRACGRRARCPSGSRAGDLPVGGARGASRRRRRGGALTHAHQQRRRPAAQRRRRRRAPGRRGRRPRPRPSSVVLDDPGDDHASASRARSRAASARVDRRPGRSRRASARAAAGSPAGRPASPRPRRRCGARSRRSPRRATGSWSSAISGRPAELARRRSRARRCRSRGRRTRRPARGRAAAPGTSPSSGACRRRTRRRLASMHDVEQPRRPAPARPRADDDPAARSAAARPWPASRRSRRVVGRPRPPRRRAARRPPPPPARRGPGASP